jgi:hypothetical protein
MDTDMCLSWEKEGQNVQLPFDLVAYYRGIQNVFLATSRMAVEQL